MKDITEREKLALLGFSDPQHSLTWYKERFDDMPMMLEKYIVETLNVYGVFPKESKDLADMERYHRFYLLIDKDSANYVVKINNTDRREVNKQYIFTDITEAAKFFINKSFTAGGAVYQYWSNRN